MKTHYLFPNAYKNVGWFILVPGITLWVVLQMFSLEPSFLDQRIFALIDQDLNGKQFGAVIENNLADELAGALVLIGGILVAFSKEKIEDEFISQIRLESLVWATYVNYGLLLLALLSVYGFAFMTVMVYNMFTLLIFFIVRFHLSLYQINHSYQLHEK